MASFSIARRRFLAQAGCLAGSVLVGSSAGNSSEAGSSSTLQPVNDGTTKLPLLLLPQGFRYSSFDWAGAPLSDGNRVVAGHAAIQVLGLRSHEVVLARTHSVVGNGDFPGDRVLARPIVYDPKAPGAVTHVRFTGDQFSLAKSWLSLSGLAHNSVGTATPWKSFLVAEHTVLGPGDEDGDSPLGYARPHGWVFETPLTGRGSPVPLVSLGRFVHSGIAVHPATGAIYQTEDLPDGGFYRFQPKTSGKLSEGGTLQALHVADTDALHSVSDVGRSFGVNWVTVDKPQELFTQHPEKRTTFARPGGLIATGDRLYFVSQTGGPAELGQVWEYRPQEEQIRLISSSSAAETLHHPTFLASSPRGELVLNETGDRDAPRRLLCLSRDGTLRPLVVSNLKSDGRPRYVPGGDFTRSEFTGAAWSPDGKWLFVDVANPGVTFAITGPWDRV